jgi:hypothetical protein
MPRTKLRSLHKANKQAIALSLRAGHCTIRGIRGHTRRRRKRYHSHTYHEQDIDDAIFNSLFALMRWDLTMIDGHWFWAHIFTDAKRAADMHIWGSLFLWCMMPISLLFCFESRHVATTLILMLHILHFWECLPELHSSFHFADGLRDLRC